MLCFNKYLTFYSNVIIKKVKYFKNKTEQTTHSSVVCSALARLKGLERLLRILIACRPKAYTFGTRLRTSAEKTCHRQLFLIRRPSRVRACCFIKNRTDYSLIGSLFCFGALEGTRTPDLPLRRRLLYPAELQTHYSYKKAH